MLISSENVVVDNLPAVEEGQPESPDIFGDISQVMATLQAPSPQVVLPLAKEDVSGLSVEDLLVRADQALGASQFLRRLSGEQYWLACQAWAVARDKAVHGTWNQIIEGRGLKASTVRQAVQVYRALPDIVMVRGLTITQIKEKVGVVKPKSIGEKPADQGEEMAGTYRRVADSGPRRTPQREASLTPVAPAPAPSDTIGNFQPCERSTISTAPTSKEKLAGIVRALEEVERDGGLDAEALVLLERASVLLRALQKSSALRDAA